MIEKGYDLYPTYYVAELEATATRRKELLASIRRIVNEPAPSIWALERIKAKLAKELADD